MLVPILLNVLEDVLFFGDNVLEVSLEWGYSPAHHHHHIIQHVFQCHGLHVKWTLENFHVQDSYQAFDYYEIFQQPLDYSIRCLLGKVLND